ncbi:MAG: peptidase, partial [Geobacter sp.]|nr:peptidase [Geobacter sp.]
MSRIIELISISNMLRLTGVFIVIWSLNGCTAMRRAYYEEDHVIPRQLKEHVVQNEFPVAKGDDVVGELVLIRLEKGDTLPDIARHFSLGLDG